MIAPIFAMIPSAYKASKLYSVLPSDGTADFTVVRASTANRMNPSGIVESIAANVPKLENVGESCPYLLLEPTAINLALRSQEIDNSSWTKADATVDADSVISPDGTLNADELIEGSGVGVSKTMTQSITVVADDYVFSCFMKKSSKKYTSLQIDGAGVGDTTMMNVDLDTGLNSIATGSVLDFGVDNYGNGWYRVWFSKTLVGGACAFRAYLMDGLDYTDRVYTGDSVSGTYLWGLQAEKSDSMTSYIETTTATVTRSADQCKNAGDASTFNSPEGTMYFQVAGLANSQSLRRITISDGSTTNRVTIYFNSLSHGITSIIGVGGVTQAQMAHTLTDIKEYGKYAVRWKENDFAFYVNGVKVGSDVSGISFPIGTLTEVSFDDGGSNADFYGKVRELKIYDEALSDSDLETLTNL